MPLRLAERMSGLFATACRVSDGARAPMELFWAVMEMHCQ